MSRDLREVGAKVLITLASRDTTEDVADVTATELGIPLLEMHVSDAECGVFTLKFPASDSPVPRAPRIDEEDEVPASAFTGPDDHALLLHTSGTSGKKKIVP